MAKTRSPEYPAIGLGEAIDKAKTIYEKDYQNKLSKAVIAEHLGYKSLSGASLPLLAALNKYGLLEGRGDETHISDLGLKIVANNPGNGERLVAIQNAASNPDLFIDLDRQFPNGKASDPAIRSYLLTRKFIPAAADTAIRAYRETKALVDAEKKVYNESNPEAAFQIEMNERSQDQEGLGQSPLAGGSPSRSKPSAARIEEIRAGTRKEVITLDEGDVVITFPENLSSDSFGDLRAYLDLFIKKMQRRAKGSQKDEAAS